MSFFSRINQALAGVQATVQRLGERITEVFRGAPPTPPPAPSPPPAPTPSPAPDFSEIEARIEAAVERATRDVQRKLERVERSLEEAKATNQRLRENADRARRSAQVPPSQTFEPSEHERMGSVSDTGRPYHYRFELDLLSEDGDTRKQYVTVTSPDPLSQQEAEELLGEMFDGGDSYAGDLVTGVAFSGAFTV